MTSHLKNLLFVGIGGGIGSMARFLLSGFMLHHFGNSFIPAGTMTVNLIGCFAIGILSGLIEHHHILNPVLRVLLITGFLGGFTTFSAFGYETFFLMRRQEPNAVLLNIVISVVGGILAVWAGMKLASIGSHVDPLT